MQLKQFQNEFYQALLGTTHSKDLERLTGLSATETKARLSIYRNSILGAKQNALKTIYPVCMKLVGSDCFAQVSNHYLDQTPSSSPDLTYIGANFVEFIQSSDLLNSVPYLADIARLEWIWHNVFYGEDNEPLNLQTLSALIQQHGDDIIFTLPLGAKLLTSPYPIDRIWQFCQPEYAGDEEINYAEDPVNLIIWQKNKTLRIERLSQSEFLLLNKLAAKLSWKLLCDDLTENHKNIDFAELLPKLCQRDLIRYRIPQGA